MKLRKYVDVKGLQEKSEKDLDDQIEAVHNSISFNKQDFVILKDSAKNKLKELSESGLSDFPFDRFTEVVCILFNFIFYYKFVKYSLKFVVYFFQLVSNITSIDLLSLAKQLRETADKITNRQEFTNVTANLKNQALHLESYQSNLVNPMILEAEMLNVCLKITLNFDILNS